MARPPASSACSPVAAAQQGHAICLGSKVTKWNICHQVAEMSCFHCSLAGWTGRRRQTISPETSPHGQLCFGGSQAHAKKCKPNCLTFLATQTLVPPLSLCFVCFPQFLLSVSGGFSSIVGLGEPEQGQHQLLQGASIGIKSQHWEQGSVPAVTYTFPGPSCSRCAHKSSLWRCLGQIHLRIHWHILNPPTTEALQLQCTGTTISAW